MELFLRGLPAELLVTMVGTLVAIAAFAWGVWKWRSARPWVVVKSRGVLGRTVDVSLTNKVELQLKSSGLMLIPSD